MAKKDNILNSFLNHELLASQYRVEKTELPTTVREALTSRIPIVKAIALVVEALESPTPISDTALRDRITQFLNGAI